MTFTRKSITAFLLVLIMMPAVYSVYFHASQQFIRWKMWSNIEEADKVIVMHVSSLKWIKKDREIKVNGLMFDVKSIEKIGDSLKITGEYDYEETNLSKELELVEEAQEEEGQQSNSMQLLVQIMDDSLTSFPAGFLQFNPDNSKCSTRASMLPTIYLRTISPPPKA